MPSQARIDLNARLADVDELVKAHGLVTGGRVGRPAQRQGAAVTRAGIVLLAAAMEAFVEDLYEEAAKLLWPNASAADRKALFNDTSRRLNNADVRKTELLFFNLGLPWVLGRISSLRLGLLVLATEIVGDDRAARETAQQQPDYRRRGQERLRRFPRCGGTVEAVLRGRVDSATTKPRYSQPL